MLFSFFNHSVSDKKMTSWGVPNEHAPLSIGGDIGILTSNALQLYSPHGERKNTLKLSNKVICSFTTGLKTNKFCLVTETPEGKKSLNYSKAQIN